MKIKLLQKTRRPDNWSWHRFFCILPRMVEGHLVFLENIERKKVLVPYYAVVGCKILYRLYSEGGDQEKETISFDEARKGVELYPNIMQKPLEPDTKNKT